MCGIVAVYSNGPPIEPESVVRATRALIHRGPDEQHQWIAPHGRVGLGHTRLTIIDLVTGAQPIASEDDHLRIIVNGEFYDFERIRLELEARGHQFRTRSDSEIALHLYEEMGPACLEHLRGEFAFAIWDEKNQTLFAARDRFGIKPLFYARVGDTLYLASEVNALFAAGVPAGWDHESEPVQRNTPGPSRSLPDCPAGIHRGFVLLGRQLSAFGRRYKSSLGNRMRRARALFVGRGGASADARGRSRRLLCQWRSGLFFRSWYGQQRG
jgi:asparagine synthetase B (glutamine-hydrolysing)